MIKDAPVIQEGKLTYLPSNDHIVSKKQVAHDAKNLTESIAEAFLQTAYWMNYFTTARAIWRMDDFTRDHLIWHQEGFLRQGYLQRVYSKIYPFPTPRLPTEPGKDIVAKTTPQLRMHDDISGREMFELTAALDYEFARGADAFIDPVHFQKFVDLHSSQVGSALGCQWNVLSSVYCMSHYPASTLSLDIDLVPFLEQSLRPDDSSYGANKWFDTNSHFWKTICKKEILGQAQQKLTNIGRYTTQIWEPTESAVEIKKPSQLEIQENETTTKSLFFRKGKDSKITTPQEISPFSCLLALSNAIRTKWTMMTQTNSPTNMGCYKPFQPSAQTARQIARTTPPQDLEIILNPVDWSRLKQNITNTSPYGNYTASIDGIIAAGTRVYVKDTMLPGHFIIQERGTYMGIIIYQQLYQQNFDFCLAVQRGAHMFGKVYISGLTAFYKGMPDKWVLSDEYMYHNFTSLSPS